MGNKKEIENMLKEGEFECLLCPHIEKNPKFLVSDEGAFCRECGCSLYYWPNNQTTIIEASVNYNHKKRAFQTTITEFKPPHS